MEAYEILSSEKRSTESFSQTIKRRFRTEKTAAGLLAVLPKCGLSEDTLNYTNDIIESRMRWVADSPVIEE